MARVTVEDCIVQVPNRFELVMYAAQRARDVSAGAQITVDRDRDKNPVVALREIAQKSLKPDDMREEFIKSLQKHAEVDEPEETVEAPEGDDMLSRQLTEEELLRALTNEAQRRAEPQPEPEGDYEE